MLRCNNEFCRDRAVDIVVFIALALLLVAPIVEIAVRRPGIFLELLRNRDLRAFAQAPLHKRTFPAVANYRGVAPSRDKLAA